jgi:hypothetical protein
MSSSATSEADDEEVLASHEAWIAIQEGRLPRPDIMNALSAPVGPASPVPGRYADAPAAGVDPESACANARGVLYDDRYARCSDMLNSHTGAVAAPEWPDGPFEDEVCCTVAQERPYSTVIPSDDPWVMESPVLTLSGKATAVLSLSTALPSSPSLQPPRGDCRCGRRLDWWHRDGEHQSRPRHARARRSACGPHRTGNSRRLKGR